MTEISASERLLIISCSQRKKQSKTTAWDLYDGSLHRMLKKIARESDYLRAINILILSSKYGLVTPDQMLEIYDERLTGQRVDELKPIVTEKLSDFLRVNQPDEIFCCLGLNYWYLVKDALASSGIPFKNAQGRIGEKLAETRQWIQMHNLQGNFDKRELGEADV